MTTGITVFVDSVSGTAEVETVYGQRQLELYYAHIGGDASATPKEKLAHVAKHLGKIVLDGALDEKRRQAIIAAEQQNAADTLGPGIGQTEQEQA